MNSLSGNAKDEIATVLAARRGALVSAFLFSCLVNVLMLTGPLFMLQVYDRVLTSGSIPTLLALSVIVLVLYLYYGFLENIRARVMTRIGRSLEEALRGRVFDAMAMLALRRTPNVGGQPIQDLGAVRHFLSGSGPMAFLDMPWVPVYLLVVFLLHPWLGVAGLFATAVIFTLALMTERATSKPIADAGMAANKAALMTDEARRGAEALHALGMRGVMRERWAKVQQEALDYQTEASDAGGRLGAASRVVRLLVQSGILALGAYLAIIHEISAGTIIASSIIMSRGLAPVEQAVANWQQFLGFRKSLTRLENVLAAVPPEPVRMKLPAPKGLLEVENLAVVVAGNEKPLLQGLSFRIQPGRGLGVIGPTGAGKSTLARALVGIIAPTRGSIRLDGATHNQWSDEDRGKIIGYLPQDVQIFDGTVAQNISRFVDKPDAAKIVEAAKFANVHDLIMRMPQGYDTPLGEGGARLSAGQRQRVALARALFGDPVLLVMDEPNSNLDADGEVALDRAIRASLARGAAVAVVAHRPSALHAVHDILVLNDGKPAALGTRDEIFKQVAKPQAAAGGGARIEKPGKSPAIVAPAVPETRN